MTTDYENQHRFDDTISVVIPVLNAGKYLPTLLPAIFSQRPVAPGEVILVDSASTDNTRE
ncbi:MAG: glycosyltransferase, partial [Kiritimatiellae bacterium]|nr:glycosyltransferase [Kiritimatiellia bacterium]